MASRFSTAALRLKAARASLRPGVQQLFPPGHYYSPIPDLRAVQARHEAIFDRSSRDIPGIDSNSAGQLALLPEFAASCAELPFGAQPDGDLRYGFENPFFSYGDGLALYGMLRHLQPKRVIEVGSGWSSALMLDVNDRFFDRTVELTFIEPYPDRLNGLIREPDRGNCTIIESPVQTVDSSVFAQLEAGDMLFIDSTHVSRVDSDVNRLLLEIVPTLPAGVTVHIHDIFWPFEYPDAWVYQGRAWNENYLLRALLIDNQRLSITWFNSYLGEFHRDEVVAAMPTWGRNTGGSIYLTTC